VTSSFGNRSSIHAFLRNLLGGLGRAADHAVVMAQLYSNGKKYGPHPFVVPIRDLKTREPLPGRVIGDVGPKLGYFYLFFYFFF
jgi:hypothetical protein